MLLTGKTRDRVRRDYLLADYERCGVPVFEVNYREWRERFYPLTGEDYASPHDFMGVYHNDCDAPNFDLPKRFILINRSMPNYERLPALWHEIGHHACVKAGCLCAKRGFDFRKTELHAEIASIYVAHVRGFPRIVLELAKDCISDLANKSEHSLHYIRNAAMMVKHPLVAEAFETIRPDIDTWLAANEFLRERYDVALRDKATRMCRWSPSGYLRRFAEMRI